MTQETFIDPVEGQSQRRGRSPANPFPAISFEEALALPKGIIEHGISGEIERLTLLAKLERSPSSSKTRELISSSYKYGLTTGSYNAPFLKVTDDGRTLLSSGAPARELKERQFELAIKQFDHFNILYERLKNQRLPDETVLRSEFGRSGVSADDCHKAADIFTANIRYLDMVEPISGNEYVRTIEQVSQRETVAEEVGPQEPVDDYPDDAPRIPVQGNNGSVLATDRPALHIDIQIHIDPTSSAELIDQIFASMAKHLYGLKS